MGCVALTGCKQKCTLADEAQCSECTYQEHLIIQRQNYIATDAAKHVKMDYVEPVTSPGETRNLKRLTLGLEMKKIR